MLGIIMPRIAPGEGMPTNKCITILSERSSGSSALQNYLVKFAGAKHAFTRRHFENETLYWTKAASILGLPQVKMVDSRVPFGYDQAKRDILELLSENVPGFVPPPNDYNLIMEGWRQLCQRYAPLFVEKSPHHLCEWSALELILQAQEVLDEIEFLVVGLVRNPLDTIYSHYKRWKSIPAQVEKQWVLSYQNLIKFQEALPQKTVILRYEDMVSQPDALEPILQFCKALPREDPHPFFHAHSVQKWKSDRIFGFALSEESQRLAQRYGYKEEELQNQHLFWTPALHTLMHSAYRFGRKIRPLKVNPESE